MFPLICDRIVAMQGYNDWIQCVCVCVGILWRGHPLSVYREDRDLAISSTVKANLMLPVSPKDTSLMETESNLSSEVFY